MRAKNEQINFMTWITRPENDLNQANEQWTNDWGSAGSQLGCQIQIETLRRGRSRG
jgi:hypothetical protein